MMQCSVKLKENIVGRANMNKMTWPGVMAISSFVMQAQLIKTASKLSRFLFYKFHKFMEVDIKMYFLCIRFMGLVSVPGHRKFKER